MKGTAKGHQQTRQKQTLACSTQKQFTKRELSGTNTKQHICLRTHDVNAAHHYTRRLSGQETFRLHLSMRMLHAEQADVRV